MMTFTKFTKLSKALQVTPKDFFLTLKRKLKKMLLFIIQGHFTKICTPLSVNRILEALY